MSVFVDMVAIRMVCEAAVVVIAGVVDADSVVVDEDAEVVDADSVVVDEDAKVVDADDEDAEVVDADDEDAEVVDADDEVVATDAGVVSLVVCSDVRSVG